MKMKSVLSLLAWIALTPLSLTASSTPLGTSFTYQGVLQSPYKSDEPVKFYFKLWDGDSMAAAQVGSTQNSPAFRPQNFVYSTDVDFGAVFGGAASFLDVWISKPGLNLSLQQLQTRTLAQNPTDFKVLQSRVRMSPTPNAIYASTAGTLTPGAAVAVSSIYCEGIDGVRSYTSDDSIYGFSSSSSGGSAIYGYCPSPGGFAGRFIGRVAIEGNSTIQGVVSASSDLTEAFKVSGAAAGYELQDRVVAGIPGRWVIYAANGTLALWNQGVNRVAITPGGMYVNGTFVSASDRNLKENFEPVEARDVLARVAALPLTRWNYKADAGITHLGPVAQDFRAAFGLGRDDKGIATVDESGVALAAIQGLNEKLADEIKQKGTEITELKQRLEALEKIVLNQNSN